jgi:hypothetical protein
MVVTFLMMINLYNKLCFIFIFFADVGQRTTPTELPIYGDPYSEIALELVFPKGNPIFLLNGKTLQLLQPLDRDEENLSHIVFQVSILKIIDLWRQCQTLRRIKGLASSQLLRFFSSFKKYNHPQ